MQDEYICIRFPITQVTLICYAWLFSLELSLLTECNSGRISKNVSGATEHDIHFLNL